MKILVVDHHAVRAEGRELYRRLQATNDLQLAVLAPRVWREQGLVTRCQPEESTLRVVPSSVAFSGKTHRNLYARLGMALRSVQPDILLVNSEPEGFLALQAVTLCRMMRMRSALVFTTWRNLPYGRGGEPFPVRAPWLSEKIESVVLPRTTHIIAHSPSSPGVFRKMGFGAVTYIPPWIDTTQFHPPGPGLRASDILRVGYVGRLVPEKGVDLLLRAVEDSPSSVHLTIVGAGPMQAAIDQRAAERGLHGRVRVLGPVPHERMPEVMSGIDVLVLASVARPGWREQFGRVLIEAMASGVVVVGSESGDIPHVIGDAGLVVPEGDIRALHDALVSLVESPALRESLKTAGLRRVEEEFSLSVIAKRYEDLFRSLVPGCGTR